MNIRRFKLLLLSLFLLPSMAFATDFTVRDIRVEGLDRLSEGSVLNKTPVRIGQRVDKATLQNVVRTLYAEGFFEDIKVGRDGDVLVIQVKERPYIDELDIKGNKLLKTEPLKEGLANSGVAEGKVYNPAVLERLEYELQQQYISQGRYDAQVEVKTTQVGNNKVKVLIDVDEGKVAKIKRINILGNKAYSDKELKNLIDTSESAGLMFWKKRNHYSKDKLDTDIETIRSHYLNNGYLKFNVTSKKVDVSEDKEGVYVSITVDEGDAYKINDVRFIGYDPDAKDKQVNSDVFKFKDQFYSQQKVTAAEELMRRILGSQGYAFSNVRAVPEFTDQDNLVDLVFAIDQGKRSYVRRINFTGNTKTQDNVLRREMRQMESAPANTALIEQSKLRLQRLSFFKNVKVETVPVPGHDDLVDVNFDVEEEFSGSIGASVGYADGSGLLLGANLQQNNFMGTGKTINVGINRSKSQSNYRFGINNPYYTVDGVSRGFNLFFKETDLSEVNVSSYNVDRLGANMSFGYPLSETQRVGLTFGYSKTDISTGNQVVQEIKNNDETGFLDLYGDSYDLFTINGFWRQSSLNRGRFATKGSSQTLSLELSVPGGDLEFYKLTYRGQRFFPLNDDFSFRLRTKLGYGDGYGDTETLPFFENFYAGGFNSVRGFEQNTLGPRSTNAEIELADGTTVTVPGDPDPFGGNMSVEFGADFIFPTPFVKDKRTVQTSVFVDSGYVYSDNCSDTQEFCSDFDLGELRASVGIGLNWYTFVGPMSFSVAKPIMYEDDDDTKVFQFSLGTSF